jgi:YHS domain-containing protein
MARLIFFIVLGSILYYVLHFLMRDIISRTKKTDSRDEAEELVQDPSCQTYIPKRSALKKNVAGRVLYFCGQECMERYFRKGKER